MIPPASPWKSQHSGAASRWVVGFEVALGAYSAHSITARSPVSLVFRAWPWSTFERPEMRIHDRVGIRLRRARLELWGRQEKSCLVCVADRGGVADPEERGQVQRIRPIGQGFLEVAIHSEPIERDAAAPK